MEQDLMTKIDFANGPYNIKRRIVSTHSSYQRDIGRNSINARR